MSGEHGANLRHDLRGEMAIDHRELGQRLRRARESSSLTQDEVANHLGVSRSTVAQIELGNRTVNGIELFRLAILFGKDLQSFVAEEEPEEENALVALYRLHPDLSSKEDLREALRRCLALGREMTRLEQLLDIDRDLVTVAAYPLPQPRTTWEAIQQGERVALEERGRLGLGLIVNLGHRPASRIAGCSYCLGHVAGRRVRLYSHQAGDRSPYYSKSGAPYLAQAILVRTRVLSRTYRPSRRWFGKSGRRPRSVT